MFIKRLLNSDGADGGTAQPSAPSAPAPASTPVTAAPVSDAGKFVALAQANKSANPMAPKHAIRNPSAPENIKTIEFGRDDNLLGFDKQPDNADAEAFHEKRRKAQLDAAKDVNDPSIVKDPIQGDPAHADDVVDDAPQDDVQIDPTTKKPIDKKIVGDLGGFDDDDKKYLKKMSIEASQHFSRKMIAIKGENEALKKQVETGIPPSYLNHPDAFVLLPEYAQTTQVANKARFEANHYRQQLIAIKSDQPWRVIEGYKNGQPVYSDPYKPTAEAEADILNAMQSANSAAYQAEEKVGKLQAGFKGEYDKSAKLIKDEVAKNFPLLADEKVLDETIDTGKFGKLRLRDMRDGFKNMIPLAFRDHPLSDAVTALFLVNALQADQLTKQRALGKVQEQKADDAIRAEPGTDTRVNVTRSRPIPGARNKKDFDMSFDPSMM